jgi:peptidoglycan/LPS O-acetylase OafA/YrhL
MPFPVVNLLVAAPLVYITVFLGISNIPIPKFFRHGDYSYEIYLYGYPVQQAVFALFPVKSIPIQIILSLLVILMFAMLSWHAVEKPILRIRKKFSFIARQRLEEDSKPK